MQQRIVFLADVGHADIFALGRLIRSLRDAGFDVHVVACNGDGMASSMTGAALGVMDCDVDTIPALLSSAQTMEYLQLKIAKYDLLIVDGEACGGMDALRQLAQPPPFIKIVPESADLLQREQALSPHARALRLPLSDDDLTIWRDAASSAIASSRHIRPGASLFQSFFQGGFECSTHRRAIDGERRDLIALSEHDRRADEDYRLLTQHGLRTARDGVRWHLIEQRPGCYDWTSLDMQIAAARKNGTQVIWDLMHYGWPDHLDVWDADFPRVFSRFAEAAARYIDRNSAVAPLFCPINEISFLAWAGGHAAHMNPFATHRAPELKIQLVRASIAAINAIRTVLPGARFVQAEPAVTVLPPHDRADLAGAALDAHLAQYEALDMLSGRSKPELGGHPGLLDIVGVNYYCFNNWSVDGTTLSQDDSRWPRFADTIAEIHARYGRPIVISETGTEGDARSAWLAYVASEVRTAMARGIPVEGICIYPVLGHIGWDDDRYCPNGLLDWQPGQTSRSIYAPLATQLRKEASRFTPAGAWPEAEPHF